MKKRARGEGSFRRKKNGRWEAQVMVGYRADGSREIKSFSGSTRSEVKQKMEDYLKKRKSGLLLGENMRFDEWADIYFEHHKDRLSETSQESYRYILRTLKNYFGSRTLTQIKTLDVEIFLDQLRKEGKSNSYLAKSRSMLSQIFTKAIANEMIQKNPVAFVEKIKKRSLKRKDSFTSKEVHLLMENLSEDRIGWSIRLMVASGMRMGELLALEPRHISEQGDWICVEQAAVRIKGGVSIGPTKTAGSVRIIPVPECVQYCARRLRDTDKKFIWETGKPGMPCNPSYFAKQFKAAIGRVKGVRILTPHSTRHTYISMLQMLNVNFETIRDLSGHTDISMTRHYLHVQEPSRLEAARRFSEAFSREEPPEAEKQIQLDCSPV